MRLLLVVLVVMAFGLLVPAKVHADTSWPDGNGNGIPDSTENAMINACNSAGGHTYWSLWANPYSINPPAGATSYTIGLFGAAYVCPDTSYNSISNAQFFNLTTPWFVSLSDSHFDIGGASRGNFTSVGAVYLTINLTALPVNACTNFGMSYSVSALHGGVYDSDDSISQQVRVCYYPQAPNQTTVGGHVINTRTGTGMANVQIGTCMGSPYPANVFTDSTGYFGFTVNQNTGYCLRVVGGVPAGSAVSAYWMNQFPYNKYHPGYPAYEWQLAGTSCFETGPEGNIYCGDRDHPWGWDLNWPDPHWDSYGSQGMDFNITPPAPTGPTCSPASQSVDAGANASFLASGGNGTFSWSAPGGSPSSGSGVSFLTNYTSGGTKTVTVTSNSQSANCSLTVVANRNPFLTTNGADIHAGTVWGANPCLVPSASDATPGDITGQVNSGSNFGSEGDYVVSAGGQIAGFGSAGNPTGTASDDLYFGQTTPGSYGQICRTDIAKDVLDDHVFQGQPVSQFNDSDGVFGVGALPSGIRYYNGNVKITGSTVGLNQHSTLVVDGDVRISNSISAAAGPYTRNSIPSLGIIATGNIYIHEDVRSLYGIYAAGSALNPSGGIISTCQNSRSATDFDPDITVVANRCDSTLQVNGALIADNIYFRRTVGDVNTSNTATETVSYPPMLQLQPPPAFSSLNLQLRFSGERPPIF